MISHFKRTFQAIYLDEICCVLYVYVYIWCFLYREHIYGVNYARNNINQIEKNLDYHLSFHSFSQIPIYKRGPVTNQEKIYKLNQHLSVKVNLNSYLFPVLEYRYHLPPWKKFKCDTFRNNCLSALNKAYENLELLICTQGLKTRKILN